ncbi:hypothetical protein [Sphingobacterium siyangense]|uniref:Toprim domain-containing protein n=1 Tax=Sphingobacterium siyangense TaxID=459529 RepID=A0A562M717_9SPHI|nr:hypothetical protein [Sphingobacterium siyangense]TWI15670.1 hypothetical protein IQ31_04953 [Sphingobacterium siyangense]
MKLNSVVSDGLNSGEEFISIKSLLNHLGFKPLESNEKESFYSNIFISNSLKPKSFRLDHALDVWFDKSIGKGGNIIDFGKLYWPNLELHALHEKLSSFSDKKEYHYMFPLNEKSRRKRRPVKLPHYQIERIRQLGITSEVSAFLQEAGLWEIADSNLVEVHYYVRDEKGKRRDFCAAGWPNENGGWEVYAKNFKSCIGSKGMSIFQASTRNITIFQEFTDYLKNRDKLYALYSSILVLNSPKFLSAAIKRVSKYKNITFYIDEKREGYEDAKLQVQSTLQNCIIQPL